MFSTASIIQQPTISFAGQKSAHARIVVKAEESLITLIWQASPTPAELAQSAAAVSALIQKHTLTRLSHDIRNIDLKDFEIQKSLIKTFCQLFLHSSLTKVVHITKYAAPELIVMDHITTFVKRNIGNHTIEFETCTTEAGATEWLQAENSKTIAKTAVKSRPAIKSQPAFSFASFILPVTETRPVGSTLKLYKERVSVAIKHFFKQVSPLYTDI